MKSTGSRNVLWFIFGMLLVSFIITTHRGFEAYATIEQDSISLPNTDMPPLNVDRETPDTIPVGESEQPRTAEPSPVTAPPQKKPVQSTPPVGTLRIPSLSIDAPIERQGINAKGAMAVPKSIKTIGWYGAGPKPGETGNAVLAGHVSNSFGLPGVFAKLDRISIGDDVYVDQNGETKHFIVRSVTSYDWNASTEPIFISQDGGAHVVLITCEGTWLEDLKTYSGRLVVVADLAL